MTREGRVPLIEILHDPASAAALDTPGWSSLVAAARRANLLGALAVALRHGGVTAPPPAARHLLGAWQLGLRQRLAVQWEAQQISDALAPLGVPVLLLKGSAYLVGHPDVAEGRLFGDVDILVPQAALGDVESRLMLHGWSSAVHDAYDQRYYREWSHELPPMVHVQRGTVIDVHHAILPPTAATVHDPRSMLARARPLPGLPGLHLPAPQDLVIHAICHLVHEGEFHNGLRDLNDIDRMLRRFGREPGFWATLEACARDDGVAAPVALGLALAQSLFSTPLPEGLRERLDQAAEHPVSPLVRRLLVRALLAPTRAPGWRERWAAEALYIRSHALRMPPWLLARHLVVKAWKRRHAESAPAETADDI